MSLRHRLILLFFGGTLLVWVPVNYWVYVAALSEIDTLWDGHLERSARVLLSLISASAEQGELDQLGKMVPRLVPAVPQLPGYFDRQSHADRTHYERSFEFQLFYRDGSLALRSAHAPRQPFAKGAPGFSYRVVDGTAWRIFGVADPKNALILYAGEDHAIRKDLASHLVETLIFPSLLAIPFLLLLIWLAVSKGIKPLSRLVRNVKQRAPTDLRPLSAGPVPVEIEPLVDALNSLFARLERALQSERQFTGYAAHELRTPLAALRVQAQVAQRETSEAGRQRALGQTIRGVDKASHLVDQLLTLARLDSRESALVIRPINLIRVAERVVADLEPLVRQHRTSLRVSGDSEAVSPGDETCFGILLRNLIDNAVRYSGDSGAVSVTVRRSGPINRVVVCDTGPGIAKDQQDEMFRRFRRGDDAVTQGSGLGLSIVRRICDLHGGRVGLTNREDGGLCCEVQLPATGVESRLTC